MIVIERRYLLNEKENFSKIGIAIIGQGIVFNAFSILFGKILHNSGLALSLAFLLSLIPVFIYTGKEVLIKNLKKRNHKFGISDVILFTCIGFLLNTVISSPLEYIEKILNVFGYTSIAITTSNTTNNSIYMIIYIVILAPAIEEIIYRGVIMRSIEKYSAPAAIIISSIIFGLMHQNVTQSPEAFIGGLLYGFAAYRYSVKFSFTLHLLNNLIGQLTKAVHSMGDGVFSLYVIGLYFFVILFLIVYIIVKRKFILKAIRNIREKTKNKNRSRNTGKVFREFFTRKSVIILIIINICVTIYNIKPM